MENNLEKKLEKKLEKTLFKLKYVKRTEVFFVLPALIYMIVFIGYPIVYNVILSFYDVELSSLSSGDINFVGFENYETVFSNPVMLTSIRNTLFYTIACLVIQFSIGFAMALFFNLDFKLNKMLKGIIIISWMMPIIATSLVFRFMLAESGIINQVLMSIRIMGEPILWLSEHDTAMWGVILANSWVGIPFNMLLLSTGLSGMPSSVIESSRIDGANRFQRFFYIILPMLKPAILSVLVLGFVYTFKVFELVYTMTAGGPASSTEVLSTYSYLLSFRHYYFSQGASVANILAIFLIFVSLIYLKFTGQEEAD